MEHVDARGGDAEDRRRRRGPTRGRPRVVTRRRRAPPESARRRAAAAAWLGGPLDADRQKVHSARARARAAASCARRASTGARRSAAHRPSTRSAARRGAEPARKSRSLSPPVSRERPKAVAAREDPPRLGASTLRWGLSATPVAAEQRAVAGAREDEVPAERREAVGEVAVLAEGVDGRVRRARSTDADAPVGAARRDEGVVRQRRDARGRRRPRRGPARSGAVQALRSSRSRASQPRTRPSWWPLTRRSPTAQSAT